MNRSLRELLLCPILSVPPQTPGFAPTPPTETTSVDWFFGFKLHLAVNERGELLNVLLTPGNTDDRTPVPQLLQQLFGKVFGDRGYISQKLALRLWHESSIQLIAKSH